MKIAILYHSKYGHTKSQAQAVLEGAKAFEGTEVFLILAGEVESHWDTLDTADAIIFGCPTYMGSVSAGLKEFMEASSGRWSKQAWKNKIAAGFTNSGSQSGDKLNTLTDLAIFAAQHSMIWVGVDLLPGNNSSKGNTNDLNRLGSFLGAMAQSNVDEGPDSAPSQSDLKTAQSLGHRVAEITKQFIDGRVR
jgi:NAD(P)H dehydrogenase (quinone)